MNTLQVPQNDKCEYGCQPKQSNSIEPTFIRIDDVKTHRTFGKSVAAKELFEKHKIKMRKLNISFNSYVVDECPDEFGKRKIKKEDND